MNTGSRGGVVLRKLLPHLQLSLWAWLWGKVGLWNQSPELNLAVWP